MAITKQDIIEGAYQDLGLGFNIEALMLDQGLRTLDRMMSSWLNAGIDIGYLIPETSTLADDSGILMQDLAAVQMNLAVQLARALSIPVDMGYSGEARTAFTNLFSIDPPEVARNPMMPVGAGNSAQVGYDYAPFQIIERGTTDELATDNGIDLVDDAGYTMVE